MATLIWIDDHLAGVNLRKPMLENHGYSVLTAKTAREGLALITAEQVAAVILDGQLPDMDSEAVVQQIRTIDATLPVVVLSRPCGDIPLRLAGHANAVFSKVQDPFSSVVSKIRELVKDRQHPA